MFFYKILWLKYKKNENYTANALKTTITDRTLRLKIPLPNNQKLKTTAKQEHVSSLATAAAPSPILQLRPLEVPRTRSASLERSGGVWELADAVSSGGTAMVEWGSGIGAERKGRVMWESEEWINWCLVKWSVRNVLNCGSSNEVWWREW